MWQPPPFADKEMEALRKLGFVQGHRCREETMTQVPHLPVQHSFTVPGCCL